MSHRQKSTWLVVGDGAAAQFYAVHAIPLRLTKVAESEFKATRKVIHGAEHKSQSMHIAHVAAGRGDHQRHENVFVEHIVQTLEVAVADGKCDDVILVLPPKALAHFRKVVVPSVQKRIKHEFDGDWTHLSIPDLERHLAATLP